MTAFASTISHPLHRVSYHGGESLVSRAWSSIARLVRLDEDRVIVEDGISLPAWIIPTCVRLYQLQQLPDDWDSYGGVALQTRHRDAALRFLGLVMSDDIAAPDIVPLADGGVQLEWRPNGVEIDFISDDEVGEPTLFITRGSESEEIDGTMAVTYFLDELRDTLRVTETVGA